MNIKLDNENDNVAFCGHVMNRFLVFILQF